MSTNKNQFSEYLSVPLPPRKEFKPRENKYTSFLKNRSQIQGIQSTNNLHESSMTKKSDVKSDKLQQSKQSRITIDSQKKLKKIKERNFQSQSPEPKKKKLTKSEKQKLQQIKEVQDFKKQKELFKKKMKRQAQQIHDQLLQQKEQNQIVRQEKLQQHQDQKMKNVQEFKKSQKILQKKAQTQSKPSSNKDLSLYFTKNTNTTQDQSQIISETGVLKRTHKNKKRYSNSQEPMDQNSKLYIDKNDSRQKYIKQLQKSKKPKKQEEIEEDPFEKKLREKEERDKQAQLEFQQRQQQEEEEQQQK